MSITLQTIERIEDGKTMVQVAEEIKFGAIKFCGGWWPVLNGEISDNDFQYSSAALAIAFNVARRSGYTVE